MDTIRWFKRQAKSLLNSFELDVHTRQRADAVLKVGERIGLQKAQHVIAVEAGFRNWKHLIDAPEAERKLAKVMMDEPLLTDFGMGLYGNRYALPQPNPKFDEERRKLREKVGEVEWLSRWLLANVQPIKTINHARSSYGLKHLVAKKIPSGYATNGVFIAAALVADYPYKVDSTPNVGFGMSETSLKRIGREIHGR